MALKCYNKPNRSKPRTFTPAAAKRVACATIENGYPELVVRAAVAECFEEEVCDCEKIKNVILSALKVLAAIGVALALVRFVPALLVSLARFAPILLPAAARLLLGRALPTTLRLEGPQIGNIIEGQFTVISRGIVTIEQHLKLAAAAARPGLIP